MEYTTPEQTLPVSNFRINPVYVVILSVIGALLVLAATAWYFLPKDVPPVLQSDPVITQAELRRIPGRITAVSNVGFTMTPIDGVVEVEQIIVTLSGETTYEKVGALKQEADFQREFAEYQSRVTAAQKGDAAALDYVRKNSAPSQYVYQSFEGPYFAVGDYVVVMSDRAIAKDATEIIPISVRIETIDRMPDTPKNYSDEKASVSSTNGEQSFTDMTLMSYVSELLGVSVAHAAVCPYSPPNGGGFSGMQHDYTWDFGAGQYMTGFSILTNCDYYSSEDGCVDVSVDSLGGGDMFYQPNGGGWTGYLHDLTLDLGPGQYISGIAYRTNCDYYSTEDGCLNVKISNAAPGTSAYRTNIGSWTGMYQNGSFTVGAGQYISGIEFRSNCDYYSTEDDCIRFKVSDFTTDDALCAPPVNTAPRGNNDGVSGDCSTALGWAQDQDGGNPIDVHFYADGTYATGVMIGSASANSYRADLCAAIGSCNHGYNFSIPPAYQTGPHTITAYAIDSTGGVNPTLGTASYNCPLPPVCAPAMGTYCESARNSCNMFGTGTLGCDGVTCSATTPAEILCVPTDSSLLKVKTTNGGPQLSSTSITLGSRVWFDYSCYNTGLDATRIRNSRTIADPNDWIDSPGGFTPATASNVQYRPRIPGTQTYYLTCNQSSGAVVSPAWAQVVLTVADAPNPLLEVRVNGGAWTTGDQTINSTDSVSVRWNSNYNFYQDFSQIGRPPLCVGTGFNSGNATSSAGVALSIPPAGASVNLGLNCREIGVVAPGVTYGTTRQKNSNNITITTSLVPIIPGPTPGPGPTPTPGPGPGPTPGPGPIVPPPTLSIDSDRQRVRIGDTVDITWDTNTTANINCSIFGPNFGPIAFNPSIAGVEDGGPVESQPITAKSEFVISCTDTLGAKTMQSVLVETEAQIEEI